MGRRGSWGGEKWIVWPSCKLYHLPTAIGRAKIPKGLLWRAKPVPSFFSNTFDVAVILIKQWKIKPHARKQDHLWLQSGLHFHPLEFSQHQSHQLLKKEKGEPQILVTGRGSSRQGQVTQFPAGSKSFRHPLYISTFLSRFNMTL